MMFSYIVRNPFTNTSRFCILGWKNEPWDIAFVYEGEIYGTVSGTCQG